MFERSANDPTFATVSPKSVTFFGLVVDEGSHTDEDEGRRIVVLGTIHVGVGGYFRV